MPSTDEDDFAGYQALRPPAGRVKGEPAKAASRPASKGKRVHRPKQEELGLSQIGGATLESMDAKAWADFLRREKAGTVKCIWFSLPGPGQDHYEAYYTDETDPNRVTSSSYD